MYPPLEGEVAARSADGGGLEPCTPPPPPCFPWSPSPSRGGFEAPSSPRLHRLMPPRLDPIDDRAPAGIEQWIGPRMDHPRRPFGFGPVDHVGREVGEEEKESRPKKAL